MYRQVENGRIIDIQGLPCCVPPIGYVYNILTKRLEKREIYKRSDIPKEQYWERIPTPHWYASVMKRWDEYEKKKKDDGPDFYDERLEQYKQQEWDRRLNGFWFMNYNPKTGKSEATYLTGTHYTYLQWWPIDVGYPKFRIPDLEKFYFLQYCIDDPDSMGMVEVTKRRFGKSFMAGIFVTEYVTRTKMTNGGIQSKTGPDAKKFFSKTVVNPFRRLPRFFRPEYDTSLGPNPKSEMRFQKTNARGKKVDEDVDKDELGSLIDWQSAETVAYDGQKLHRYVCDEVGKCFGKGTKVLMYDGSIKNVEDIRNGELVMGDDSTPRKVYGVTSGKEELFEIIPNKGEGFICNKSHILSLSVSDRMNFDGKKYVAGDILNISVSDYFKINPIYRKCLCLYSSGWEMKHSELPLDPYVFGLWLGDGSHDSMEIHNPDIEVRDVVFDLAEKHTYKTTINGKNNISIHVSSHKRGASKFTKILRDLNVYKNKHIPDCYLKNSRENRLQLLAGIIDTDGYLSVRNGFGSNFEITQKRQELALGIKYLCQSLGFYVKFKEKIATMKRSDGSIYKCLVYRISIYGDLHLIPTKVSRKIATTSTNKNRRNPLKRGFNIRSIGAGDYYGFAVDRNSLFLLSDGTVVHNTKEVNVYDRHEVVRYCLLDDEGRIIGKALYTTTVEKLETEHNGIQEAFKLLWDKSNQLVRGADGRTESGLYRFFMSAKRTRYIDIYGYPDEERALKAILADRETVKNNPRALNARTKKEPLTIEEAFSADADTCAFNAIAIQERLNQLKEKPVYKRLAVFYRKEDGGVAWRDAKENEKDFCWQITQFPPDGQENKHEVRDRLKRPARVHDGAICVDSYSNSQGGRKYGSKACAWIGRRADILRPTETNKAIGCLYGRPEVKDKLHEQVMLAAEFYGYPVFYEHTADDYEGYFRERGKIGYLGMYPMTLIAPDKRDNAERYRGTPITPFSLTRQMDLGIIYFNEHCDKIDWIELLDFALVFDPYDRTKYDMVVSFLILLAVLMDSGYSQQKRKVPLVKIYEPPKEGGAMWG